MRIPDNMKHNIIWLMAHYANSKWDNKYQNKWQDFEEFCIDVAEIVCADDTELTLDARQLKQDIINL